MKLRVGMKVPDFDVIDIDGKKVSRDALMGSRYMISFYRYASCPFCNLRMSFLIEDYDEFKANDFELIAFFHSTREDIQKNVGKQKSPFPIVADSNLYEYKKFGIEQSVFAYIMGGLKIKSLAIASKKGFKIGKSMGPKTTVPGDFLVDEKGFIRNAYYGKDITDHLDIDIVKKFAAS